MSDQIKEPHPHDVLSGSGNFVHCHVGNEFFRKMVRDHKVDYVNCPKQQKGKFSVLIFDKIKQRNPPGRFLKRAKDSTVWYDIGVQKALDKTRQALREGAPGIRLNLLNSSLYEERRNLQEQYELGMALHNHQMMILRRAAVYTPNEIPYYMLQQHQQPQHHQQYQGQQHTHQSHLNPPALPLLPHHQQYQGQQHTHQSHLNPPALPLLPHHQQYQGQQHTHQSHLNPPALPLLPHHQQYQGQQLTHQSHLNPPSLPLLPHLTSPSLLHNLPSTVEEDTLRWKKLQLVHRYRRMLFSYSNNKYNPPFLYDEKEFNKEEFPIRMMDDRVLDRFTEWVLSIKFDQFTKLPLVKTANIDHMHGLPGYISKSRDGMFRCLCSSSTNTMIGYFERVIAANSTPCSEGTADITAPYDIMNVKNKTLLAAFTAMLTETIPGLKKDWKEAPTANIVRDEERQDREKIKSNRGKRSHNKGLSESAVEYLKAWMMSAEMIAKPYPTRSDKLEMINETGLEIKQLEKWLGRYRAALKKAPPPVVVAAINGDSTTTTTTATNTTTNIAAIVTSPIRENQVID